MKSKRPAGEEQGSNCVSTTGIQPSRTPHLPPALQARDAVPNPSAAAHISLWGTPKFPAPQGSSLPKGTVLGQAMEQEWGLTLEEEEKQR